MFNLILRCSILSNLSHFLLVLNSSVNIIIYGWKDSKFREVLLQLLHLNYLMKENSSPVVSGVSRPNCGVKVLGLEIDVEEKEKMNSSAETLRVTLF